MVFGTSLFGRLWWRRFGFVSPCVVWCCLTSRTYLFVFACFWVCLVCVLCYCWLIGIAIYVFVCDLFMFGLFSLFLVFNSVG